MITRRTNNYKNFTHAIKKIEIIEALSNKVIILKGNEGSEARLTKTQKGLELKVEDFYWEKNTPKIEELQIEISKEQYLLKSADLNNSLVEASLLKGVKSTHTFSINGIETPGFNNTKIAKYIGFYPTLIKNLNSYIFITESIPFEIDTTIYSFNCIRLRVSGKPFDVVQYKSGSQGFYIIESLMELSHREYNDSSFAIRQSLGFITGYMPGGHEYIFADDEFSYSCHTRPSLRSIFYPVNSNSYAKLSHNKVAADQFLKLLNKIPINVVSRLATLIKDSSEFSAAVLILLEAGNAKSLLLIPSVFAVIIETLSKLIHNPDDSSIKPVKDIILEKKIYDTLSSALDTFSDKISQADMITLKRRLSGLNRPIIQKRLTNNEKLTAPFIHLDIRLTIEDIKIIEHRNDLLHGNVLLHNNQVTEDDHINKYMAFVAGKMYTLISKLILKYCGYNGYVINYGKLFDEEAENEQYYDRI